MSCLDGIWLDAVSDKNVLSVPFLFSPFNLSPNSTIHKTEVDTTRWKDPLLFLS